MRKMVNGKMVEVIAPLSTMETSNLECAKVARTNRKIKETEKVKQAKQHDMEFCRIHNTNTTKKAVKINRQDAHAVNYDRITDIDIFTSVEEMANTTSASLKKHKNSTLEYMCESLGVKKSGKKADKIHAIMEYISQYLDNVNWVTNIDYPIGDLEGINYIFENGLHELACYFMVRKMAYEPMKNTISEKHPEGVPYLCYEGCMILMKNSHDTLWDDCRQAVAMTIWENAEKVGVKDGYIYFKDSAVYGACLRAISNVFGKQRLNRFQKKEPLFAITYDEKGDEKAVFLGDSVQSENRYISTLSEVVEIDEIISNDFVNQFFTWVHDNEKYKKYYSSMYHLFYGKCEGLTNQKIMSKYNISRRIFDKCFVLLRQAYIEYDTQIVTIKDTSRATYGNITYKATGTQGGYNFHYEF